ncbi:Glycerophosphoryl diester phosphodiesterase [Euzebya pacifica]|uniref:Glycerophosphoryl diester phosphodiesterase n=2 Tax=Euzebya pacifica TaxID=1608957 RepID=A0A346Y5C1_9ACTN|nr:Glycerophosphoryl diester phosphodiesterase [Euzebya pacifica]
MMRRILPSLTPALIACLLVATATVAGAQTTDFTPPPRPADTNALRVMTYNVRYASNASGHEDWGTRFPDMAAQLQQSDLDLLGTQELKETAGDYTQRLDILDALGGPDEFGYIGTSRGGPDRPDDEQMGIYYRLDRLELVEEGHFWLSPTPNEPYSFGYGNTGNSRMASWGHFRDRRNGHEFYAVNTHFDHANNDARYRAADQIAGYFTGDPAYDVDGVTFRDDLPVVITGDFNFNRGDSLAAGVVLNANSAEAERLPGNQPAHDPMKDTRPDSPYPSLPFGTPAGEPTPLVGNTSPYHRLVTGGPFIDAWDAADVTGPAPTGTFSGFGELDNRWLDWILASESVEVLQAYVDTYRPGGEWPSDHLPVVADVVIPAHHDDVDVVAHRGASRYAPENTLPAIEMAIAMGAEQVEIDVSLSADQQIILLHDNTLSRTTNVEEVFAGDPRVVADDSVPQLFTAAELATLEASNWGRFAVGSTSDDGRYAGAYLGTHVPTLAEALALFEDHPDVGLLIELKAPALSPGIEQILIDQLLAERAKGFTNPHVVQSFHPDSMELYAHLQVAAGLDLPVGQLHFVSANLGDAFRAQSTYADGFNPSHGSLSAAAVAEAHQAGLTVTPYTINDSARQAELVAIGVDGVITDRIDRLQCVLRGEAPEACDALPLPEPFQTEE